MSKDKRKNGQRPTEDRVWFNAEVRTIHYNNMKIAEESIKAFFGLAIMGKMMRFCVDDNNNAVVVERVPDNIESLFGEISRILTKYKDKPMEGFKAIEQTIRFAEKIGVS